MMYNIKILTNYSIIYHKLICKTKYKFFVILSTLIYKKLTKSEDGL